jgi:cytochrome c553
MHKNKFIIGLLLVAASAAAGAEPSSKLAWTAENLARVHQGDATKGKQVAEGCLSCHALGTQPEGSNFPALQGQLATYLYKQLQDYKDGSRANDIMTAIAKSLSDADMADVAAYYAAQEPPHGTKTLLVSEKGENLVERGDSKRILPPCEVCHEPNGRGQRLDVPAVAGQNAAYLEQTLLDYKSGARHNDLYGRMRSISQQLSAEEIKELARYYSGM